MTVSGGNDVTPLTVAVNPDQATSFDPVGVTSSPEPLETPDPADVTSLHELESNEVTSNDNWRTEVLRRGKYWQKRERGRNGKSRYGGKFNLLSPERQVQYDKTKARGAVPSYAPSKPCGFFFRR